MKPKVIIVQKIFPHYRKAIFDLLNEKLNIILLHSKNRSGINQVKTGYSLEVSSFRWGKKDKQIFLNIFPFILKNKPQIIIHEFTLSILSLLPVILLCKILNIKLILWSHGYNRRLGFNPKIRLRDKLRLLYIKMSDALLLYSKNEKVEFSDYINEDKIFVANNTLDTKELFKIKNSFIKSKLKKSAVYNKKFNLVFIGRLIRSKKPELMIDIIKNIKDNLDDQIMVHIIGDGGLKKSLQNNIANQNLEEYFRFYGAVYDDNINSKYLYFADLLINPGEMGLSIIHAFCFDTPVASFKMGSEGPYHGPEISNVHHFKTGLLASTFNIKELSDMVLMYMLNRDLQKSMKCHIKELVKKDCTIEKMYQGFDESINYVRNKK